MRRLLVVVLFVVLLVAPVFAWSTNLQNGDDMASYFTFAAGGGGGYHHWEESTTGGNDYIHIYASNAEETQTYFGPTYYATTYAAWNDLCDDGAGTTKTYYFLDSVGATLTSHTQVTGSKLGRLEMKMSGTTLNLYYQGTVIHSAVIATNPYKIRMDTGMVTAPNHACLDDVVYGSDTNKYVFGLPESDENQYIILNDITSDASDGLYYTTTGTQVSSTYMSGTWSRGNTTTPLENESIQLIYYDTGTVYATNYTGTSYYGTVTIDIKTLLIDAGAPDGYYALTTPGTGAYSNLIMKKSNGASVSWDKDEYNVNDVASVITVVAGGGYWNTATYDYKLGVMDIYGDFHGSNTTITTQTQTVSHEWDENDDDPGVYYAILFATEKATGEQHILGLDWAELSAYVAFSGYVNNAQNSTVVPGAVLNFTQGTVIFNGTSGFDGNYSTVGTDFYTGAKLYINATNESFRQYLYNFTPLAAKQITLNISLTPLLPNVSSEIAIGGVARDIVYGRPIEGATVVVQNTTNSEHWKRTTSMTGWYLCGWAEACYLENERPYDVWGNKTGYHNSTVYSAVTA